MVTAARLRRRCTREDNSVLLMNNGKVLMGINSVRMAAR